MNRHVAFSVVALALIAAGALGVFVPARVADVPLAMPLDLLPTTLRGWTASNHVPREMLPADTRAPHHLVRAYRNGPDSVWVAIGYYPSQAEGRRPPTRDLLFPAQGWTHLSEQVVALRLAGGGRRPLRANLVVMDTRDQRVAVLYWYEMQGRSIASDHWYRAALIYSRLVHRRADGALVRVAVPAPPGATVETILATEARFLSVFYPELLRMLPR